MVGRVAAIAAAVLRVRGLPPAPARDRVAARPVDYDLPRRDAPLALPPLEAVHIAQPRHVVVVGRPVLPGDAMPRLAVGLRVRHIAVQLDVHVAEEVLRRLEVGQHLVQVDDEPLDVALVAAVVVVGVGVIDRAQEVHVEAVDGPRIARQHVADGALVGGVADGLLEVARVRSHCRGDSRPYPRPPQPRRPRTP